ncbi:MULTISPECIES: hypothetical protein [Gordonia]|uniref:hypothetical protein n=1 Tax=Gordonia TaxID=2053 RepID=UPI0002E7A365|nr:MULTISPECIES: hypothetical protein [Gordonia]
MRATPRSTSFAFTGYLILLLAFLFLGLFVVALADGVAAPAWPFGVGMAVLLTTSVACFRHQSVLSRRSRFSGGDILSADPMTPLLRRADIERYERTYRPSADVSTMHRTEQISADRAA